VFDRIIFDEIKVKKMKIISSILLIIIIAFNSHGQNRNVSSTKELEKYVGYYSVGVKPERPFFNARAFFRNNSLFIIFDGDVARELIQGVEHQFHLKEDSLLKDRPIKFTVLNGIVKGFKLERPRDKWSTDLYGKKNESLSKYAVDTEAGLVNHTSSLHFDVYYGQEKVEDIGRMMNALESRYKELLRLFAIDSIPKLTIRIYPDLATYHNAVLTPEAPDWQAGRAWTENEIRMVSSVEVKQDAALDQLILHEFVHCLNLHIIDKQARTPGWLWEGVAMYKGCCRQFSIAEINDLKNKKRASLRDIEKDPSNQLKYQFGYYLIEFIDKTYGWEKVVSLMRTNGNIKASLNISVNKFENDFYNSLVSGN
jgi:hypothetical protein